MSLRIRRGTDSERLTIVPAEGELLYTTDTKKLYVGDDITTGGNVVTSSGGSGGGGTLTSDIVLNNHSITGTNITIDGQSGYVRFLTANLKLVGTSAGTNAVLVTDASGNLSFTFTPKLNLSVINTNANNILSISPATSGVNTTFRIYGQKGRSTVKARYIDTTTAFIDPSIDIGSYQIEAQDSEKTIVKSTWIGRMEDLTLLQDNNDGTGLHSENCSFRMTTDGYFGIASWSPHYTLDIRGVTNLGDDAITNGQIYLNWSSGISQNHSVLVKARTPKVTLTSSATSVGFGNNVTFTATLTKNWFEGTPIALDTSGTVLFYTNSGNHLIGTGTISSNVATITVNTLQLGEQSILAQYSGDSKYLTVGSNNLAINVVKHTSTTAVIANQSTIKNGNYASFAATVTPSTATGTVTFGENSTTIGTATVVNGYAYFQILASGISTGSITATYSGDTYFSTSTSSVALTVGGTATTISTSTSLISSDVTAVYGTPITLTATITPGTATGIVNFLDGATVIGTGQISGGEASLIIDNISVGSNTITARYCGNDTHITSASTFVTITISENSSSTSLSTGGVTTLNYGETVTLTATVSSSTGTPTGTVTFKDGTSTLGSSSIVNGVATYIAATNLAVGSNSITAVYNSDNNYSTSTSSAHVITVSQNSVSLEFACLNNTSYINNDNTITVTIFPNSGNGVPSGTVTLFKDGVSIDTGTVINGIATFTLSGLSAGLYHYAAEYSGDTNFIENNIGFPKEGPAIIPSTTQIYDIGSMTNEIRTVFTQNLISSNSILSSSKTGGIGYSTGAGGTITQSTNKETTVVLNAMTGKITLNTSTLNANTITSFTFTNSAISETDIVMLQHQSGGTIGGYTTTVTPGNGTATVYVSNNTGSPLSEAIVLRFIVMKSVNS